MNNVHLMLTFVCIQAIMIDRWSIAAKFELHSRSVILVSCWFFAQLKQIISNYYPNQLKVVLFVLLFTLDICVFSTLQGQPWLQQRINRFILWWGMLCVWSQCYGNAWTASCEIFAYCILTYLNILTNFHYLSILTRKCTFKNCYCVNDIYSLHVKNLRASYPISVAFKWSFNVSYE